MHYLSQGAKKIEVDQIEETEDYLKTAFEYFSEEIKSVNEIENEEKRNLFIEVSVANKGK